LILINRIKEGRIKVSLLQDIEDFGALSLVGEKRGEPIRIDPEIPHIP